MNKDHINKLSKEIYEQNKERGWWDDPDRCVYQTLQLVSTEVSEGTEGCRKDLMDDKLPHYKMECVELADALIRILDLGGRYELIYAPTNSESPIMGSDKSAGANHLGINIAIVDFAKAWFIKKEKDVLSVFYSAMIDMVLNCARYRGFNLASPLQEKLEVNKKRKDHSREHRATENGKKF